MAARATTADKAFLGLFILFAVIRGAEFFTGGHPLHAALGALGFGLMAFGTWNRAFAPLTEANLPTRRRHAQIGTYGGMAMVLASLAMKWMG
ncbi:hypothetical protein EBB59_07325 [Lysobacter pythonis]|uniref:Uncharacterized protein n=1 Tax=Solilutibacter pythonis TaxID=2483112 RepID=A0A3M2HZE2_9GAMM|nr:hypothetical protein [Lysobacter pythonis]RMH93020.1 hypothetical protein EBB59_07325 [Lysobacter pythonis]